MHRTLLWLGMASLACSSLSSLADGAPLKVLAAPNIFRVRTPENIFVECQDCSGHGPINVHVRVRSYPTRTHMLAQAQVKLDSQNNYQALAAVTITDHTLIRSYPNVTQYVYVQAQFPDRLLEKVVMVSFQSGYIFIQTDKTIYTPNSRVYYRTFAVTPRMEPTEKSVTIELQTPEGIIFQLKPRFPLRSGIISEHYDIPAITSIGVWKVAAFFPNSEEHRFYAEFEVKEYVLPSFEVKLEPKNAFFKVDSETFEVQITAKYLYGKYVDGNAYVVFGVFDQDKKTTLTGSLQKILLTDGKGTATLERKHINQTFPDILELVQRQSSIYATVSVLTQSGSELVEAEMRGIHIVTSPYTISLKKTPKYFKPGWTLDVTVEVTNPDNTPAPRVAVRLNPGDLRATTDDAGVARVPLNIPETGTSSLQVTAITMETGGSQASATITVNPYRTSSKYADLHIGVVKNGNNIEATISFGSLGRLGIPNLDITYLVLSGGQILQAGREKRQGHGVMQVPLTLTKEMLPSFRVIVYYHLSATEVVSDSVVVDVKYTCMGSLKIESATEDTIYQPGKILKLKVTGDPGALVGLVAVDKGVYVLNNKYRLTQRKVLDIVEKHDAGCTPGGGKDSMGVFYDAGLMFVTDTAFGTNVRTDPKCPASSTRRRRATTIADARITLERQYDNELQRKCCVDGMRDTPLSYDCQRRSEYIVDQDQECIDAFLHCCGNLTSQRADKKQFHLANARSGEDDGYDMDISEIVSRTKFDESWLFDMVQIPDCSPNGKCEPYIGKGQKMPDSITTWQLTGISLSKSHGICVSEPFEVIARKQFFIDLRLPYSAVRGEQLEIKAILHNLNESPIEVRLELLETENVCSLASRRKKYRVPEDVVVGGKSTRAVPFVIIPMQPGQHDIEVKGTVKHAYAGDGIKKKLLVVHAGELKKIPLTISLEPSKHNGVQQVTVNIIPRTELQVPGTKTQTQISITGGSQMSSLVENALSGKSMEQLIRMPGGCAEQNIGAMAFPVIAATYLDAILKWEDVGLLPYVSGEDVGLSKRDVTLKYIRTGYTTQLTYRQHSGGCFSLFKTGNCRSTSDNNPCCRLRLTAYVVKVFAMASNLVTVDNNVLCGAVSWLIAQQKGAGNFEDSRPSFGMNTETSVTAFTLIALKEAQKVCPHVSMQSKINKAVAYLEGRLLSLRSTYAVAITSYALALADRSKFNKAFLLGFASGGRSHWSTSERYYTSEATGYALLALVTGQAFKEAEPVVKWLNQQRSSHGSYGSSQATMVVYQALAEYWTKADVNVNELDVDLDVEISVAGRKLSDTINFNKDNIYTTRTLKEKNAQNLTVTASGTGEATLTVVSLYYALPTEQKGGCEKFNLSVKLIPEKVGDGANELDVYMLKIEVMYNSTDTDATMTILDIRMPTGYVADNKDLDNLSTGVARPISKYEMDKALSEQGSIIIYLEKVSHERPEEIAFRIEQKFKVAILQPAAVSVYEYYNEKPCVKFYRPERTHGELLKLCRGDVCVCAEENCSKQKKDKISNDARKTMACQIEENNRVDYVYKVRVEDVIAKPSVHIYKMRIVDVLKEGSDAGVRQQERAFISFPHCTSLGLDKDKSFLIMGVAEDMHFDADKREYEYVLGERTWIEYWPTPAECQIAEYRHVCLGLEALDDQLNIFGCHN